MDQTTPEGIVLFSIELSNSNWKLSFGNSAVCKRQVEIPAGDTQRMLKEIAAARKTLGVGERAGVRSCYEAGLDGFWLHRALVSAGVGNLVIDSSSIEVNRKKRRAKSDRIDGRALLRLLSRHVSGEPDVFSIVRVPTEDEEDSRRLHREMERLKNERTQHRNRIRSLLQLEGVTLKFNGRFLSELDKARRWNGTELGADLRAELKREHQRLGLVEEHLAALKAEVKKRVEQAGTNPAQNSRAKCWQQVKALMQLKGISMGACILAAELFCWRDFKNRRQVGACAGLTDTPYSSGQLRREQGISKAGNARVRRLMVELAWCWLRYQSQSKLSKWFEERFGTGKRSKRVGIVAVARKLLVALWKYVTFGEMPEGAELKAA